ncbi:MAG: YbjN domain-containing protein [Eubacterium sp.]|nr:YbjN domain-containing protein [Eubacterium sp.]
MSSTSHNTFVKICALLDSFDWHYERNDEKEFVRYKMESDDLPVEIFITINENNNVLRLLSFFPFKVPEDKRVEMALAICHINSTYINGYFDFDVKTGEITFRMNNFVGDGELGAGALRYMMRIANSMIDDLNDKLFALSKGYITLDQFTEQVS